MLLCTCNDFMGTLFVWFIVCNRSICPPKERKYRYDVQFSCKLNFILALLQFLYQVRLTKNFNRSHFVRTPTRWAYHFDECYLMNVFSPEMVINRPFRQRKKVQINLTSAQCCSHRLSKGNRYQLACY
jgi:hypothetical protein